MNRIRWVLLVSLLLGSIRPVQATDGVAEVKIAFQDVALIGFTRPRATVQLIAEEAGRFETVAVDVGDVMGEQQRFGCLDSVYIDLDLAANQARQTRLQADLAYFSKQVTRFHDLVKRNTTAQSELDDLQRKKTGTAAELTEAEIEHRRLLERKRRHCIEASRNWHVTERLVEPGQWVKVGDPVGTIADFSVLLVPFALSHAEFKALQQQGDDLQVRLVDEQIDVAATPVHLNPDFDEHTRKISVDLALDRGVPDKRGGLRVQLLLRLPDPSGAVLVPPAALEERYEQHWVQKHDGTELAVVYLGRVKRGQDAWARVVAKALKPGDRVRLH